IEWNQNSTHQENIVRGLNWNGEPNIRFGNESLWMDIETYENEDIVAVRHEKREKSGVIWDTDYVMNFREWKMAIRLDRSFAPEALKLDSGFSTPHFITLLIQRGFLEDDGDLTVERTPHIIDARRLDFLAGIIKGRKHYRLPVVFISRTYHDEDPVDIGILAGRLKGVAHVLAQDSNVTNPRLKQLTGGENEYYGAIGIYFPTETAGHRKYPYHGDVGYDMTLLERVIRVVIQYSNSQMIDTLYTWQGVNNALLRDHLQNQRERYSQELAEKEKLIREKNFAEDLVDAFDDDMKRLQRQVDELTRSNEALQYENHGLRAKLAAGEAVPLLTMGDEEELYPNEIKELVLAVLDDALKKMDPDPQAVMRRRDVVADILQNNAYQHLIENRAEEIKRLLKNYDGMPSRLRSELERFGFTITEEGKHYKLTYFGDERYQTTFSKTPSDVRTGKNSAQEIQRKML
ncbi:MAG: hypothetical protein J6T47_04175, partial [Lachnospiraceae bacterium]|nr:hypothetical protein [Lachnospiraceae bacterium]